MRSHKAALRRISRPSRWWLAIATGVALFGISAYPQGEGLPPRSEARPTTPNIVLILSDDQRYDTLSAAGHPFIETPNIDRLAREGAMFDNSFVITSLCNPSRATLLTARYTHRTGITSNTPEPAKEPLPTVALRLKAAGYQTAFFGKYHLSESCEPRSGFDHWECLAGHRGHGAYENSRINVDGTVIRSNGYSTDVMAERASAWIAAHRAAPFFILLSLKNPHLPMKPPARHRDLFADSDISEPESYGDSTDKLPAYIRQKLVNQPIQQQLERIGGGDPLIEFSREYARAIPCLDDAVGTIRAALETSGVLDDTLLIFTSDNGILLGEHGLMRKGLAYEESIRVPLIMRLPGRVPAGIRPKEPVLNVDVAATLLAAAGVLEGYDADGSDLLGLLAGSERNWRQDWLYLAPYPSNGSPPLLALRGPRWKYVRYRRGPLEEQLFDLQSDRAERHDLAREPAAQETLVALRKRMRQEMDRLGLPAAWWDAD